MNIREIFQNKVVRISSIIVIGVIIILVFIVKFYTKEEVVQPIKEKELSEIVDDFSASLENKKSPQELRNYVDKFSADLPENEKNVNALESVDNFSNNIKSNN